MNGKMRDSNIELLRILTTFGVIMLHYNNPVSGGGIKYASGINLIILYFLESFCICAVNLFMLISGYYMYKTQRRILFKPMQLFIQVIVFAFAIYFLQVILHLDVFSIKKLAVRLIPANYFVILYITIYFISPFINVVISNCNICYIKRLLMILFFLFSIWPTFVDFSSELTGKEWIGLSTIGMYGSQWGYTVVNFALMYFIGAAIRKNDEEIIQNNFVMWKYMLAYFAGSVLLTCWAVINDKTGFFVERSAWEYCNPIVIFLAVVIFQIFKNLKISSNKGINELAKGAFTVFLIHNIFIGKLNIEKYVTSNIELMLFHIMISVLFIYSLCWIIYEIYSRITEPVFKILKIKFSILTSDLTGQIFEVTNE